MQVHGKPPVKVKEREETRLGTEHDAEDVKKRFMTRRGLKFV
ncbi:MAG: hypothetical protein NPIRA01_39350 [Nitrospirales bacterium]|nr:MAG: hypothetical protein NPIRA01_39350 [Nitrospirales bacterium]